jgi:hypothetical protein
MPCRAALAVIDRVGEVAFYLLGLILMLRDNMARDPIAYDTIVSE